MFDFFKRKKAEDSVEYPCIARVTIIPIRCKTCGGSLNHDDLTIWHEKKNGWKSGLSHAECVVFIRYSDLSVKTLKGEPVKTDGRGGILDPLPKGAVLLTESEWETWSRIPSES